MLSWNVLYEDFNKKEIVYYDIFKGGYFEGIAKDLKERVSSKELFAEEFRIKLMSMFWARSEYVECSNVRLAIFLNFAPTNLSQRSKGQENC